MVVDTIACDPPKTKIMAQLLGALAVTDRRNLLVVDAKAKNLHRAGRNVKNLNVKPLLELNAYDVLQSENIIFDGETLIGKIVEVVAS